MGNGEQGDRWWEEERLRQGEAREAQRVAQGREEGWPGVGCASQSRTIGVGPEGGRHTQPAEEHDRSQERRWQPNLDRAGNVQAKRRKEGAVEQPEPRRGRP